MDNNNATDHSFFKTNDADFNSKYLEMYKLHPVNVQKVIDSGMFKTQEAFEKYIKNQAADDFNLNYMDEPE